MKPTYIIGDIHGKFQWMVDTLVRWNIRDCTLICVGDFGMGFVYSDEKTLEILNDLFTERGIHFIAIRGNHDDPAYFKGQMRYSNLELVQDYSWRTINGEKFLFVGGAISVDRSNPIPGQRVLGKSYWLDEVFILAEELCAPCDVLITHSAPRWVGPHDKANIEGWCKRDKTLWAECTKERDDVGKLVELTRPSKAYGGHFHEYHNRTVDGTEFTILGEMQIKEHTRKEYENAV